jgi:hypothetical protein
MRKVIVLAGKLKHLFWGAVSILVGAFFGYATARNLLRSSAIATRDGWILAACFLFAATAVYFVWVGNNQLQRASGQDVKKPRLRWGKLLLGFWIAFISLKAHFEPGPNALRADNEAEAGGMLLATLLTMGVGLLLMVLAFRPPKEKPAQNASPTDHTTAAS